MIRTDGNLGSAPRHLTKSPFSSIQYKTLTVDQMSKEEKLLVLAKVKTLATGKQAAQAIGDGWTYSPVDMQGRVGILKRNGVEVALFIQRQLSTMERGVGDPVPESILTEPDEAWQRFDLMGPSAKRANFFLKREIDDKTEKIDLLTRQADNLQKLVDQAESAVARKQTSIEHLNVRISKLAQLVSPDDKIIVRTPGFKYVTEKQAKTLRKALAEKEKRKAKAKAKAAADEAARQKAEDAAKKKKKAKARKP